MHIMQEHIVRNFLFGTPTQQDSEKGIYEHGALRKVHERLSI